MSRKTARMQAREYVAAAGLSLLLVWLLWLVVGIARKEEIARHAVADTQAQLTALSARKATLEQDLADLSTERGQETVLRETYGVAKPGEEVIIVVPQQAPLPPPPLPWWKKALRFIGL